MSGKEVAISMATGLDQIRASWRQKWPAALDLWSRFTRLREPHWCVTQGEAAREGLTSSFAMIRLTDQTVVVSLEPIQRLRLDSFSLEILAHEIGHHVYCPADLTDHARMLAKMRPALPSKEALAPLVANLYADLLVNDRLQRTRGLHMSAVYERLASATDPLWTWYMRTYEILWSLVKGSLARGSIDDRLEGDAHLGARLIRSYAAEWLGGSGRFAALCLPYLLGDGSADLRGTLDALGDLASPGRGGAVTGLTSVEDDELGGAIHPALDPKLSGLDTMGASLPSPDEQIEGGDGDGQYREPFAYGEILRALGMTLDDHEIAVRYYRERAIPYLVPFPRQSSPRSVEPLPEALEPWSIGDSLDDVDWVESIIVSPNVVPGVTTVRRQWGTETGGEPRRRPLDLDLYVDSSGSMPNPQQQLSIVALAGAVTAMSALRVGARVQATLWSGARQFITTGGFILDERSVLQVMTAYLGGATAFPVHMLGTTYQQRQASDPPVHILVISDEGVTTMFDADEQGNSGWDIARHALDVARGGGTMALDIGGAWEKIDDLRRARDEGWRVYAVTTWEGLLAFASEFSRLTYAPDGAAR